MCPYFFYTSSRRCASNLTRSLLMFPMAVVTRRSYRRLSHWLLHFRQLPVYIRRTATSPYPDKTRTCSSHNSCFVHLFCTRVLLNTTRTRIILRIMVITRLLAVLTCFPETSGTISCLSCKEILTGKKFSTPLTLAIIFMFGQLKLDYPFCFLWGALIFAL